MAIRSSSLETQLMVDPGHHSGSHNMGYVMRANSSALTLRLVWQSSLATLPFSLGAGTRLRTNPRRFASLTSKNVRLSGKV